jgi:hypothetical protein
MDWQKIKTHWLFSYFTQKNKHPLVPILTFVLGAWMGMLISPVTGAFLIGLSLYFALVIYFPWDKISQIKNKNIRIYLVPAIITILIILPFWNKLVSIFPITDPYKQPLLTGNATIEVIISSDDKNIGTNFHNSWCYRGRIFLVKEKEQELFLEMWIATVPGIHIERIENNQLHYSGELALHPNNKTTGKPIKYLTKAETALICIYDNIPQDGNVISGEAIITLNSSVCIKIPIPPQIMDGNIIVIQDIQKYITKGNRL